MNNVVKYPCRGCVYFKVCGENTRTHPCDGRKTKSEVKKEKRPNQCGNIGQGNLGK